MPPSRSGIADYSEALVTELSGISQVTVFADAQSSAKFRPDEFDVAVYQVGNNGHHDFVYETALRHPGVVVMHEANLHHLITDLTIRRNDWDSYVAECAYNGGAAAEAFAERVRSLEIGPDYEGVNMTRRLLEHAAGVIVHSDFMVGEMRAAGYQGPIARIPHGAWMQDCAAPQIGRNGIRQRLGLDARTPLIGTFGFLKPYKRIAESLRAFRRLTKVEPRSRLILGGEPHPDFPLQRTIEALGLDAYARILGFTPISEFAAYIEACDIILNLRFPTVGETSGSLLRSLGAGRAVLVSNVGAFRELPDDICLKVPVDLSEEDVIFESLNLLVSRPDLAQAMGERAREWVKTNCSWSKVAQQYAHFLTHFRDSAAIEHPKKSENAAGHLAQAPAASMGHEQIAAYVKTWATNPGSQNYVDSHRTRLARTLEITPPGTANDSVLEMGAYLQITPALRSVLGYGNVRGCYFGELGKSNLSTAVSETGEKFECVIDLFDAEKDIYPYADGSFQTVLCCELIEHLFQDPMHLMGEVNRILCLGGHLVLTTPNIASLRGLEAILQGYHPGLFHAYIKPSPSGEVDPRHNREYTPMEISRLFEEAGFEITRLETGMFREQPRPEHAWVEQLLRHYGLPTVYRGEGIYAVGRKIGPVRSRWPSWLYV